MPTGPITGSTAQQAAEQELRKGEYHHDDPSLVQRAASWLLDKVGAVFDGRTIGSATLVLLLVLVAAVVFAVVRVGRPRRLARAAAVSDPLAPDAGIDHERRAAELSAAGRLGEALREWLRAAAQTVERRGVLDPKPGRTGAELARGAGAAMPSAARALLGATSAFDEVWFGGRPATEADVDVARDAARLVRTARISEPATPASDYALPR